MNAAGRKRRAPITLADLPPRAGLAPEERARVAKLSLALHADLLGLQRGSMQNVQGPRYGVGDASPERMQHARRSGDRLVLEQEFNERDEPTGLKRKRFVSRIEQMRDRGSLDVIGFAAASKFQADVAKSQMAAGARISSYEPRYIDCAPQPELTGAERSLHHQAYVAKAYVALPRELHRVLDWLADSVTCDRDLNAAAAAYWPTASADRQKDRFRALLELTCALLARHYGLEAQHKWAKLQVSRVAQEIYENIKLSVSVEKQAA